MVLAGFFGLADLLTLLRLVLRFASQYSRNVSYGKDRLELSPDSNEMVEGGRMKRLRLTFIAKCEGPKFVFLLLKSKDISM
jgi:hypothetical protein